MRYEFCLMVVMAWGSTWAASAAEDPPTSSSGAAGFPKPYSPPCVEREDVFEFTEKPKVKSLGNDKYEITFAVSSRGGSASGGKGYCDVTAGIVDAAGVVVRHLGSGVLGANAPLPFQKNSLKQTIYWDGKDDLGEYHKTPEKLKVRVQLGLKPEFDKRLGITSPKSIPAMAWGVCLDENGAYLFFGCEGGGTKAYHCRVRQFDHDGNYVRTVLPPPANMPEEKLQGLGFVEYEAGRRALHTPTLMSTWGGEPAGCLPHGLELPRSCRPAIVGGRIYYCTLTPSEGRGPSLLHSIRADGSLEAQGVGGRGFLKAGMGRSDLAASPDGKWVYAAGDHKVGYGDSMHAAFRCSLENDKPGEVFVGELRKPGSDNSHFNSVRGIDCDAKGRLYVGDHDNNRIQIFTPDGRHAKTIPLDRPVQINVHRKTGALYVMHTTRVGGKSVNRICKMTSYDNPNVEFHLDCPGGLMALDSWTTKPRLWLFGTALSGEGAGGIGLMENFNIVDANVRILEEDGKAFRKIVDFEEEVNEELRKAGVKASGGWSGSTISERGKMVCDPVQEQVYFQNSIKYDLKTGAWLGSVRLNADDIAFDKRSYMHCHFNPAGQPGVGRLDSSKPGRGPGGVSYLECPYDYGVDGKGGWLGILPVRDQLGSKYFQDGVGVNMMGDVAENCNIYYVPKMGDETRALFVEMTEGDRNYMGENPATSYANFEADVQRRQKLGEEVYWIRPQPGVPRSGATIWTFDRKGELRDECAVNAGGLINGVMIDEDGGVYFVCNRTRRLNGKPFLAGRGGFFGAGKDTKVTDPRTNVQGAKQPEPFTGTLIKTRRKATMLTTNPHVIPLNERPARPPDLGEGREDAWCEGAEWFYAGASPIVPYGCSCPTMRFHTDWYKRTFVPEAYRHSIGVLDTAGNLILHIGQYGNFDSGYGAESKVPVGGDGIAFSDTRMVSGTDNYLCFCDRGERIIVLKLNYHAEETVGIGDK